MDMMTDKTNQQIGTALQRRLNVGCGRRFHTQWTNVDLEPCDDQVVACDILHGLPFPENTFDAVYHSHVLEHLSPQDGQHLLEECYRVLKPGGVLRIVVPDLEQIAKLYLEAHQHAWTEEEREHADYDWMKLELLDQLVRDQSGGQMGQYITSERISNEEFVRSRLGDEFLQCREHAKKPEACEPPQVQTFTGRIGQSVFNMRKKMTRKIVRWLMGAEAQRAFDEGLFRRQGEVHRWMYDRFSLKQVCEAVGFRDFQVCDAMTSRIDDFGRFELDAIEGKIRKPDSLFSECVK